MAKLICFFAIAVSLSVMCCPNAEAIPFSVQEGVELGANLPGTSVFWNISEHRQPLLAPMPVSMHERHDFRDVGPRGPIWAWAHHHRHVPPGPEPVAPVPEPSTLLLLATGIAGLAIPAIKRKMAK